MELLHSSACEFPVGQLQQQCVEQGVLQPTALTNTNHYMEGTGLKLNIWAEGNWEVQVPLGSFICGVTDSQGSRATPSSKYAVDP